VGLRDGQRLLHEPRGTLAKRAGIPDDIGPPRPVPSRNRFLDSMDRFFDPERYRQTRLSLSECRDTRNNVERDWRAVLIFPIKCELPHTPSDPSRA
jgi:hypothetical protein